MNSESWFQPLLTAPKSSVQKISTWDVHTLKRAKSPIPRTLLPFNLNLLFLVVILNSFSRDTGDHSRSSPPPPFYFIQAHSTTSIALDRPPLGTKHSVPEERLSSTTIGTRNWSGGATIIHPPRPPPSLAFSPFQSHTHHPLRGSRLPWATAAGACALHPSYVERPSRVLSGRSKAKEGLDSRNTAH